MPFPLPSISRSDFSQALAACSPEILDSRAEAALYLHYQELSRWNQRLSLIGPGTVDEIIERHYGEALAALPLVPHAARTGLDIGSGAGFPGLVLAAARLDLEMVLAEARERKWAFLAAAARRASLPCRCLNVRVGAPLPAGLPERLDVVTARALKLGPEVLAALAGRLGADGRILLWVGEEDPELPPELSPSGSIKLAGSRTRRILQLQRTSGHLKPSE
jgi:16S rRNA (guanine(527)-N(7))-methyltransferase RsmG